ncbi:MAG: hypothetical protein K1W16_13900 [Lachnospiraceae bacterium]
MGLSCKKSVGTMRSIIRKLDNQILKEKQLEKEEKEDKNHKKHRED